MTACRLAPDILLFDSGVGALSLIPALEAALPRASLVLASDNAAHPYGSRDAETLTERVATVLAMWVERYRPQLLIVACNTASTVALPRLRHRLALPVIGVVPAIKPAAAQTASGCIALLATPATVTRPYTDELITRFASGCEVLRLGSSELVALAEAKLRGQPVAATRVREVLAPLRADPRFGRLDTMVLGCTHFPLLQPELAQALPAPLRWVDSGAAIARRAADLAAERSAVEPASPSPPRRVAAMTADDEAARALHPALRRHGFAEIEYLALPVEAAAPAASARRSRA